MCDMTISEANNFCMLAVLSIYIRVRTTMFLVRWNGFSDFRKRAEMSEYNLVFVVKRRTSCAYVTI